MRPQAGQVIHNKYRLVRLIGDGGMGSVYEARHEVLGTTVALKFLHPELSRRSGLVQRFLQEARVSAQIQSAHVVRVVDVDQTASGLAFIVMEYLEGKTLQALYEELYRAGIRLAYADALEYAMQMLEGVEAAHRAGVVHRDLKPDNVIITRTAKGEPLIKLLDFGIAKLKVTGELDRGLTRPGVIMGTPEYMAPEQAYSADSVDARADIFSLGVIIFEMLAGRRPVGGDEPQQIAGAYLSGQISRLSDLAPELAPGLCAAVHRAMAASPPDRFATTAELRSALEPFARAARAPSALTPSPSEVSVARSPGAALPAALAAPGMLAASAAAPATNAMGDGRTSSVPKTIPPEGGGAHHASSGPPGALGPSTPMGGFASDARGPSASAPGAPGFTPRPEPSSGPYFAQGGYPPVGQPATVSAAPYMPAQRVPGVPATSYEPGPFDASPRPGGTAVGNVPFMDRSSAPAGAFNGGPAPGYGGAYGGGGMQGYIPGTAPMEPLPRTSHAASAHGAKQPARRGTSLFTILLLATGITGAVVGGVYIASELGRGDQVDAGPAMPTLQPANTVPSEPSPPATTAHPAVTPPPVETPPVVAKPQPRPTATSTSKPPATPSTTGTQPTTPPPTTRPSGTSIIPNLPPIVIPSTFPFPFPAPTSAQPPAGPQQTPTTTTPTTPTTPPTTPSGRPSRRVIIVPNN